MDGEQTLFVGQLVGINFTAWRVPRQGWSLRCRYSYEYAPPDAETTVKYDRLTRGELVSLLDTLRAAADVGSEY